MNLNSLKKYALWIGIFLGVLLLILNAINYDYRGGYDASGHIQYSKIISSKLRFPTKTESHENYNPPLFYLFSGSIIRLTSIITGKDFDTSFNAFKPVGILLAIGYLYAWYKIIQHLYSNKKIIQSAFLIILFSLPVFHKTIVMFNTEILLSFLVGLSFWYFITVFQHKPNIKTTFVLASLCSLALLTRFPALSLFITLVFGIIGLGFIKKISPKTTLKLLSIFLIFIIATTSWFYYGRRNFGIYQGGRSSEPIETPFFKRQPLAFYFDIPFTLMMNYPIRFSLHTPLNRLIPIYYSDFWGDWWNYFSQRRFNISVKARRQDHYLTSPDRVANLALQNKVNLPATLLMIAGFLHLIIKIIKGVFNKPDKKWLIEGMFISLSLFTWAGLLIFLTKYPYYKANGVKASYMLSAIPVYVYSAIIFLFNILKKNKLIFTPLVIWLVLSTAVNLWFDYY